MNDQKKILMINAKVNKENMQDVQSYLTQIMPVFAKNGGSTLARYKTLQEIEGTESPEIIAIVEFPSAEVITEMIISDDYTALTELRAKAFSKLNLMICTTM